MKRGFVETAHHVSKKLKVAPREMDRIVVGHGCNFNIRHARQVESFTALVPTNKSQLQLTDDKSEVLQKAKSELGIYMEWLKKKDTYFMWGSSSKQGLMIKFEFHGGFEALANVLEIKNPLLAFSDGFDDVKWGQVKHLLLKLFGHPDGKHPSCAHDYLYAFTRTAEILHLRVFKILEFPGPEIKSKSMKLQFESPAFILKPIEIHRKNAQGCYVLEDTFFDENKFMFSESPTAFTLDQNIAYSGSKSQSVASHVMQNYDSLAVILPLPVNNSWLGFNTSCNEFFERFHAVREIPVPGKGSHFKLGTHKLLTRPARIFFRLLIMKVGEAFGRGCCFSDFTADNVFLKRGKAAILGVSQVGYTIKQAKRNFKAIFDIVIVRVPHVWPSELEYVSKLLLVGSSTMPKLIHKDPRTIYPLLVHSFAWMDALDKHHMVSDLYGEFLTFLDPTTQSIAAEFFPDIDEWETLFDSNKLLKSVRVNNLDNEYRFDEAAYQSWKESRAKNLNDLWHLSPADATKLFNGRLYFGNLRNSYTHLPEHGLKARFPLKLNPEAVDLIVSSVAGKMDLIVQEKVPDAFSTDDPRKSYERFSRYFSCDDEVEFDSDDEK